MGSTARVNEQTNPSTGNVEWLTVALIGLHLIAFAAVVITHESMPALATVALLAILGCFHLSLQHEVLHGHPTRWQSLNETLVWLPAVPYLPYQHYRDSHRLHHRIELTMPGIDPESFYVDQATWDRAGSVHRAFLRANRTLLGRMLIGTGVSIARTLISGVRAGFTHRRARWAWLTHSVAVSITCVLVLAVADMPTWEFLVGWAYGGLALTQLRSFAEHLAVAPGTTPCAVVNAAPPMALLFLNNNLHHTHHAHPAAAWFRLPALHRQLGSDSIAAAGAGLYRGYGEVLRRYLVRPFDQPIHPDGRVEALS
jgi:fatty acid desaturase